MGLRGGCFEGLGGLGVWGFGGLGIWEFRVSEFGVERFGG